MSTDDGQTWDPLWDMQETMATGAIAVSVSSPNATMLVQAKGPLIGQAIMAVQVSTLVRTLV